MSCCTACDNPRTQRATTPTPHAVQTCLPLPWSPKQASGLILAHMAMGHDQANRLAISVLTELYPVTHDNTPIAWSEFPKQDAAPCLVELYRMAHALAQAIVADFDYRVACDRYRAVTTGKL